MKIGPFDISFSKKGYRDLSAMILREKSGSVSDPKTVPTRQLSEYRSWQYSAVSLIGRSVAQVNFKYINIKTEEEIKPNVHNLSVIKKPFENPNPFMTFRFIKEWMQDQYGLCGMAAAYKARNILGETREIWPLNMNDFQGAYDLQGRPIEFCSDILPNEVVYIFMIGGKRYSFKINELILLINPHPKYFYIGASPIQAQAYMVDIEKYIEVYERDFFQNSARVDMCLITDDELNQDKADEIKQRWKEKYGNGHFNDIAVLDKGLKPVPMEWTNKDFEFLNLAKWSRDKILAAYGINPAKLGITDNVNRSNSVYVNIDFMRDVIQPLLTMWDEELTQIVKEYNPNIRIVHDNPIPRDRQIEYQEERVYLAGAPCKSINEARKTRNFKPVEDKPSSAGDMILVPNNLIPLHLLEKYWKSQIKARSNSNNQSQTDPSRHDNDDPHLNPDGSDDRDSQSTDQRSFSHKVRSMWFDNILKVAINNEDNLNKLFFKNLMISTIKTYLHFCKQEDLKVDDWVDGYSTKIASEFYKTFMMEFKNEQDWKTYCKEQMDGNVRIAKICNSGITSAINYARYLILNHCNMERKWVIDRNFCGHRGRIKEFVTKDRFRLGDAELRFPGEILNLNCDCMIDLDLKLIGR